MKISSRKSQGDAAFRATHDSSFDTIRPTEHAARDIHPALLQQFANSTRAHAAPTQAHLCYLIGKKAETLTDSPQEIDVALTIMTEGKAAAEINLLCVQPIGNDVAQKIFSANLGKVLIKANNYGLFDAQHAQRLDFLIKGLQEWRRGFGVQHCPRMRLKSDHSRHRAYRSGAFDHGLHDELMTQMQSVKHAERHHRRADNLGVIGSVKQSHKEVMGDE
jgi:hypothetical protein